MKTQVEKAVKFKELHDRNHCFVIPNPWDVGSAKILAHYGFEALATTSAGLAFSLGRRDAEGQLSINEALDNAHQIVEATDLPVSADLENGYSNKPEDVFIANGAIMERARIDNRRKTGNIRGFWLVALLIRYDLCSPSTPDLVNWLT